MAKKILIIQGHPDPAGTHLGNALDAAYEEGAVRGKHTVKRVVVATLNFPLVRSASDWETSAPPQDIVECQQAIAWADHLVFFYPLLLGDMPALLKAFLEQVARPGFAFAVERNKMKPGLRGKTARIVVTMGMPGVV